MSSTTISSISPPLDDFLCSVFLETDSEIDLELFSVKLWLQLNSGFCLILIHKKLKFKH